MAHHTALSVNGCVALALGLFGSLASSSACPYAGVDKRDLMGTRDVPSDQGSLQTLASSFGKCPTINDAGGGGSRSRDWWPCQLRLDILRQNAPEQNPRGLGFDYAAAFSKLDYNALKADIKAMLHNSQPWWPADYNNYGPFIIRAAWHSAGTYRTMDGRGGGGMGQQRFAPWNSFPDNANLDKARRLLWPIKQKYGRSISWADLLLLAGNVAIEDMGGPVLGFGAGRPDTWQSDESPYWGAETTVKPQGNDIRYNGSVDFAGRANKLEPPLAATHMGLVYVNPEGPNANADPVTSAMDIRETFLRMGMNDNETVALIAGGHAFGKTHGAVQTTLGPAPEAAPLEAQSFGWISPESDPHNVVTSGLEVVWTKTPTQWGNGYLNSLFSNEWTLVKSPAGAQQFEAQQGTVDYPDPFNGSARRATMLVSDLALRQDPEYAKIAGAWKDDLSSLEKAFAAAWFKLLHRDMGPVSRYLGPEVPKERFPWQDPLPEVNYTIVSDDDVEQLKKQIMSAPGVTVSNLVATAWGSAATFRSGDKRGGANGGRIALEPQVSWAVNNPNQLKTVLAVLSDIKKNFDSANGDKKVSLADLIVLGGNAAIEQASGASVPFTPGRVDALQEDTDTANIELLNPQADGFRNYRNSSTWQLASTEALLIDRAHQLSLTVPEMTVLVGGMRALNTNFDGSPNGILTSQPGKLTNEFFVNLLDIDTVWTPVDASAELFTGKSRSSGQDKWKATRADLVFGSHAELRAVAEVYAEVGSEEQFVQDFATAWNKVMNLDRFDVVKK